MGEIGLPGLIRLHRLKARDVSLGPLPRLRCDKPAGHKDAPDRRGRGRVEI